MNIDDGITRARNSAFRRVQHALRLKVGKFQFHLAGLPAISLERRSLIAGRDGEVSKNPSSPDTVVVQFCSSYFSRGRLAFSFAMLAISFAFVLYRLLSSVKVA